jgi:hypothetical protein
MQNGQKIFPTLLKNNLHYRERRKGKLPWVFSCLWPLVLATATQAFSTTDRLTAVVEAFTATDSLKEQNLFCKGRCNLAKFSHRVTSFEIESVGARTLLDVLKNFPGIMIKKNFYGQPSVGIYGVIGQSRILIFVDGVRQNDPYDGASFLSLPAQAIEIVDVYYGPGGTWFGEGSLAAVISVTTKHLPEIRQFGFFGLDQSVGSGLFANIKNSRLKASLLSSLVIQHQKTESGSSNPLFRTDWQNFPLKNVWLSGFLDFRISHAAQIHLSARSTLVLEEYGPSLNDTSSYRYEQRKLGWITNIHLQKKRAQKNIVDAFVSAGFFSGSNFLYAPMPTYTQLKDHYHALRLELGAKFHFKPWQGHDLFFGVGGDIQGILKGLHKFYRSNATNSPSLDASTLTFSEKTHLFGRKNPLFQASRGHAYAFIQDEWQIKPPLLFTVGARFLLPAEPSASCELLPHIGLLLIPVSKLRIKIAYQTSQRSPTFYEESDRAFDAKAFNLNLPFEAARLTSEKSSGFESSIWYADSIPHTQFKTGLVFHFSQIDNAISTERSKPFTNRNEIHIFGIRSITDVIFSGGHSFSLGIFYSMALKKLFDNDGYATCRADFFNIFPGRPRCQEEHEIPNLIVRAHLNIDMMSLGGLNLIGSFFSSSQTENIVINPYTVFEVAYLSKPLSRYIVLSLGLKTAFFSQHQQRLHHEDALFLPTFLLSAGISLSI